MANILRPRRGKKATAIDQLISANPLKKGEVFFEVPDTGVGTGAGKIKMGDGVTGYEDLPYMITGGSNYDDIIGDTDISEIADGTLTGAVVELNSNLTGKLDKFPDSYYGTGEIPNIVLEITNDMITKQYMYTSSQDPMYFNIDYTLPKFCYIILKFADDFDKTRSEFEYWSIDRIYINGTAYYMYCYTANSYNYATTTFTMYNPKRWATDASSGIVENFIFKDNIIIRDFPYYYDAYTSAVSITDNARVSTDSNNTEKFTFDNDVNYSRNAVRSWSSTGYYRYNELNPHCIYYMDTYVYDDAAEYFFNFYCNTITNDYPNAAASQPAYLLFLTCGAWTENSETWDYITNCYLCVYLVSHGGFSSSQNRIAGISKAPIITTLAKTADVSFVSASGVAGKDGTKEEKCGKVKLVINKNRSIVMEVWRIW